MRVVIMQIVLSDATGILSERSEVTVLQSVDSKIFQHTSSVFPEAWVWFLSSVERLEVGSRKARNEGSAK
jgi:hypothetical protein